MPEECSGICNLCMHDYASGCSDYLDHFYHHPEICNNCYEEKSEESAALLEDEEWKFYE